MTQFEAKRRLQWQNGSYLIVIPKIWADKNLKRGAPVTLRFDERELRVLAPTKPKKEPKK